MAKKKGFDPIADAQEIAQHNINPYYWVNKVTSYTYARWMAEKKLAPFSLPLFVIFWAAIIFSFTNAAASRGVGVWSVLLNFNDFDAIAFWGAILFMAFLTLVNLIAVIQLLFAPRPKPNESIPKKEKKKKMPRHRKDYH